MDRLIQWRLQRGLSVGDVAAWLRVSPQTVRKYEAGTMRPTGQRFTRLAKLLGKTRMELEAYFLLCKERRAAVHRNRIEHRKRVRHFRGPVVTGIY